MSLNTRNRGTIPRVANYQQLRAKITQIPIMIPYNTCHAYLVLSRGFTRVKTFAKEHPYVFRLSVLGLMGIITSLTILPFLGFGVLGPTAGSIAAAWQSSIGNVVAGSLFALFQSAGMGGATSAIIAGIGLLNLALLFAAFATTLLGDRRDKLREAAASVATKLAKVGEEVKDFAERLRVSASTGLSKHGEMVREAAKEVGASVSVRIAKAGRVLNVVTELAWRHWSKE